VGCVCQDGWMDLRPTACALQVVQGMFLDAAHTHTHTHKHTHTHCSPRAPLTAWELLSRPNYKCPKLPYSSNEVSACLKHCRCAWLSLKIRAYMSLKRGMQNATLSVQLHACLPLFFLDTWLSISIAVCHLFCRKKKGSLTLT